MSHGNFNYLSQSISYGNFDNLSTSMTNGNYASVITVYLQIITIAVYIEMDYAKCIITIKRTTKS